MRTRQDPASTVEFGCHVQAALSMAMLSFLKKQVAQCDAAGEISPA